MVGLRSLSHRGGDLVLIWTSGTHVTDDNEAFVGRPWYGWRDGERRDVMGQSGVKRRSRVDDGATCGTRK